MNRSVTLFSVKFDSWFMLQFVAGNARGEFDQSLGISSMQFRLCEYLAPVVVQNVILVMFLPQSE